MINLHVHQTLTILPGRCVAGYEGGKVKNPIVRLGSGSGGPESVDDMKALFPDDGVAYGYIRMVGILLFPIIL